MNPHGPFHGGHGAQGWHEAGFSVLPFVGGVLLLLTLLMVATALYLWHQGNLPRPKVGIAEEEAKRILAERFARGDIGSEEFLERASMLNWTPGADPVALRPGKKRRWGLG